MNCNKLTLITIFSLLFLSVFSLSAQDIVISGTVVDTEGQPVIGAGVFCKGQESIGVTTDVDGSFSLKVPKGTVALKISSLGMEDAEYMIPRNAPVGGVRIILKYEENILEQVVVTGYSQTTVKRITGSVGIISSDKFEAKPISSVSALMQGELAGVQVSAISGQPGTQSRIRIRGTNNLSGSSDPLWVVDGVPLQDESPDLSSEELATGGFDNIFVNGIGNINPNDIESITVLKDAAASAIYGSRAANGVIVVTTKRGQAGRMKVNYSNNFTWSFRPQRDLSLMNSAEKLAWEQELWDEFSAAKYEKSLTDNSVIFPVIGVVGQIRAGVGEFASMAGNTAAQNDYIESLKGIDTDWYDVLFRNAFSHNHHLSLSGGSDRYTYYVSMGYNDDNGMLINNRYQRYNLTANVTMTPADFIKIDIGLDTARQSSLSPDSSVDAFTYAYFANPYEAVYNADGSYAADRTYFSLGYYNGRGQEEVMPENGFSILRELNSNYTDTVNWSNSLRGSLDIRIFRPLKFIGLASYTFSSNTTDKIVDKNTYTAFRDRLGRIKIISLIMATVGMIMATGSSGFNMTGITVAAASGLTYAGYLLSLEKSSIGKMDTMKAMLYICIFSSLFTFITDLFADEVAYVLPAKAMIYTVIFAVLNSCVAHVILLKGVKYIGAGNASIYSMFEPVSSVIGGMLILRETITPLKTLSCIIIFTAVLIPAVSDMKKK